MYDEIGEHFSRTRQKTYGNKQSANWRVTDKYLGNLASGSSILDIGCGNGKLVTGIPSDISYLGTDFSKVLLSEAKKLHPERAFRLADVTEEKHWENLGEFDAIFAVAVLHHIPKKEQQLYVLKKIKEHLVPNGFAFITVWNLWQVKYAQYQIDDHFEVPYNRKWKRYCVAYDIQSMTDLVTEPGLDLVELYYADSLGEKSDIINGSNLVCVVK